MSKGLCHGQVLPTSLGEGLDHIVSHLGDAAIQIRENMKKIMRL